MLAVYGARDPILWHTLADWGWLDVLLVLLLLMPLPFLVDDGSGFVGNREGWGLVWRVLSEVHEMGTLINNFLRKRISALALRVWGHETRWRF